MASPTARCSRTPIQPSVLYPGSGLDHSLVGRPRLLSRRWFPSETLTPFVLCWCLLFGRCRFTHGPTGKSLLDDGINGSPCHESS